MTLRGGSLHRRQFRVEALEARVAMSTAQPAGAPDSVVDSAATDAASTTSIEASTSDQNVDGPVAGSGPVELMATTGFNRRGSGDKTPLRAVSSSVITRGKQVLGFTLKFNGSLAEAPARDVRNYRAFEVTKPNKFLSQLLYQDNDPRLRNLPIGSAAYLPAHQTVVLVLKQPRRLERKYRIGIANPTETHKVRADETPLTTLTDTEGNPLAVPTTRRGLALRGPLVVRPNARLSVDQAQGQALVSGVLTA